MSSQRLAPAPPRVVMVVPSFPKLSETFIVSKFLGLLARGFDVSVVCDRSDPAEWQRFEELARRPELRARVITSPPTGPLATVLARGPARALRLAGRNPAGFGRSLALAMRRFGARGVRRGYLDAALIAARPDLIHFEFGTLARGRCWLGEALGCRIVASFRGFDLNMAGLEDPGYYREVWDRADALHLLGENLWQRALRRGCPADKPHVLIPPAIDLNCFTPQPGTASDAVAGTADRPLRIVSVGRLHWNKGYDFALLAIRRLLDRGVRCEYRIVGDGDYLEATSYAMHQLGLGDRVTLLGALPRRAVQEQVAWSDVMLHAAVSEGFCNAVIEAQAMARPVVASDAHGLPENVADGQTGFVVARRDPDALADRLARLAADPELRQRMGAAGRARTVERFDVERQADAFAAFYRQLLDPTARAGAPAPAGR